MSTSAQASTSLTDEPVWVSLSTYFATAHESKSSFWFAKAFTTLCTTSSPSEYEEAWHTCNESLLTSDCETPLHVYQLFLSIRKPAIVAGAEEEEEDVSVALTTATLVAGEQTDLGQIAGADLNPTTVQYYGVGEDEESVIVDEESDTDDSFFSAVDADQNAVATATTTFDEEYDIFMEELNRRQRIEI